MHSHIPQPSYLMENEIQGTCSDQQKQNNSYTNLLKKYREIYSEATKYVRKKCNSLHENFKKVNSK